MNGTNIMALMEDKQRVDKSYNPIPTVMVVEDSSDTLKVFKASLQMKGYRVVEAVNGEEAVEIALRTRPDLILMDLHMPLQDGLAATQRMREHEELRHVTILAITAYDTYGIKEAALEAGCDEYLTKPIDFDQLDKIISRLLNG